MSNLPYTLRLAKPSDVYEMTIREHDRELLQKGVIAHFITIGEYETLIDNETDSILGIGGAHELWEGVAEVLIVPSDKLCDHGKILCRIAKRRLDLFQEKYHRLQTSSLADPKTDKWMEHLGFECEGTLKAYSANKDDYRMWARVVK